MISLKKFTNTNSDIFGLKKKNEYEYEYIQFKKRANMNRNRFVLKKKQILIQIRIFITHWFGASVSSGIFRKMHLGKFTDRWPLHKIVHKIYMLDELHVFPDLEKVASSASRNLPTNSWQNKVDIFIFKEFQTFPICLFYFTVVLNSNFLESYWYF